MPSRNFVLGSLSRAYCFSCSRSVSQRRHELRSLHQWNGVIGTVSGVAAHHRNQAIARTAGSCIPWLTAVLGLALIVPCRVERSWFRWAGWMAFVLAGALGLGAIIGLFGLSIHHGMASFDQRCPLDGPCRQAPESMSPEDWRTSYVGLLSIAAAIVATTLSACIGVRWALWAILAVVRRAGNSV